MLIRRGCITALGKCKHGLPHDIQNQIPNKTTTPGEKCQHKSTINHQQVMYLQSLLLESLGLQKASHCGIFTFGDQGKQTVRRHKVLTHL